MSRHPVRVVAWILALAFSLALAACGGDDHKNMDHGKDSGAPK